MEHRERIVWPIPPDGLDYVRQTLPGGDYISTGVFSRAIVNGGGRGRTFQNCKGVTSLFFDADLLSIYDAAREARGGVLEVRAADRKARLYAESPDMLDAFRELMLSEFIPVIEGVVGAPPTLLIDSGWGFHAHYAISDDMQGKKEALRKIAAGIIAEVNVRALGVGRTMAPPINVRSMLDATFDVGARLARLPGSRNTKAPGDIRKVVVVNATDTVLTRQALGQLHDDLVDAGQLPDPTKEGVVPKPRRPTQATKVDVDFRSMTLSDGRCWQTVVGALARGERTKVICPFGGTSVGSGFFAVEPDGSQRYYSSPTSTTYWNTHIPVRRGERADLIRGPGKGGQPGEILRTVTNLCNLLRHDTSWRLWYDEFKECEMNGEEPLSDSMWVKLITHMEGAYQWAWKPSQTTIWACMEMVCRERRRNPVVEYLSAIEWDGVPRMDRLLIEGLNLDDNRLHRIYSRRWLIGLIARALQPGCKHDVMLCVVGPQGYQKSTFFRELVNLPGFDGELFSDTPINLKDKDSYLAIYTCWLMEDAEMTASSRAMEESKKAFLSSAIDRLRPPFGRKMRTYKRHTVLVGSSNELTILRDRSGSRRYWVVETPKKGTADIEWVKKHRDQILGEAVAAFKAGEQWWLTSEEEGIRRLNNNKYQYVDHYAEAAAACWEANGGGKMNRFTVAQFGMAIRRDMSIQAKGMGLSSALQRQGFARYKSNGAHFYYKPKERRHNDNGLNAVSALTSQPSLPYVGGKYSS